MVYLTIYIFIVDYLPLGIMSYFIYKIFYVKISGKVSTHSTSLDNFDDLQLSDINTNEGSFLLKRTSQKSIPKPMKSHDS